MTAFNGFNASSALAYAKNLAYPRLVGTPGELRAADEIAHHLEAAGWKVERLPFRFSTRAETFLKQLLMAGLIILVCLNITVALGGRFSRILVPLEAGGLVLVALTIPRLYANQRARAVAAANSTSSGHRTGEKPDTSANLYAEMAHAQLEKELPYLLLMAHYDSKSQNMALRTRVILYSLAILTGLSSAVLAWLILAWPGLQPALHISSLCTLASILPLLAIKVGNQSPGAIDNASGAGLVMHLAETLAIETGWQDKLKIACLFTSAEELGLLGAQAFIQAREKDLIQGAATHGGYVLNFDGIGIQGELHLVGKEAGGRLSGALQIACQQLGQPLKRFRLPGALFDHMPFAQLGLETVSLITVGPASESVHTFEDTADQLHPDGFECAGMVALGAIAALIKD